MRRRIEIPGDVARAEGIPEDLDSTQHAPYSIPSTRRRLRAAWVYAAVGALAAAFGLYAAAVILAALAAWHFAAAWRIGVLDPEALEVATREVGFPVGHASAVVGFDGIRARPVWNVLVFDAGEPPSQRALVRVDAVDGRVVESYTELMAHSS